MNLEKLTTDQLKELIKIYARNIYALDGLWFQSIEQENGMEIAIHHDRNTWQHFTEIEAQRIKKLLQLPDNAGLDGLQKALALRFSALANPKVELIRETDSLTYRVVECRVQSARKRKNMPYHPCKSVGIIEHANFAKIIDDRIKCIPVSCFPDVSDDSCSCSWKFVLEQ